MIALLAAGAGSRMGGGKLARDLGGRPLGAWALATARDLGLAVMVVAAPGQQCWLGRAKADVSVLENDRAASGMASSLVLAAMAARSRQASRLLVLLADMPFVRPESLRMLLARTRFDTVTASRYPDGRLGPPACFGGGRLEDLLALEGDKGARQLLGRAGYALPMVLDPREMLDVDTPEDLARAARRLP